MDGQVMPSDCGVIGTAWLHLFLASAPWTFKILLLRNLTDEPSLSELQAETFTAAAESIDSTMPADTNQRSHRRCWPARGSSSWHVPGACCQLPTAASCHVLATYWPCTGHVLAMYWQIWQICATSGLGTIRDQHRIGLLEAWRATDEFEPLQVDGVLVGKSWEMWGRVEGNHGTPLPFRHISTYFDIPKLWSPSSLSPSKHPPAFCW